MEIIQNKKKLLSCGKVDKIFIKLIFKVVLLLILDIGLIIIFETVYLEENNLEIKSSVNGFSYLFFKYLCESLMIIPGLIAKKYNASNHNDSITNKGNNNIDLYIFNP